CAGRGLRHSLSARLTLWRQQADQQKGSDSHVHLRDLCRTALQSATLGALQGADRRGQHDGLHGLDQRAREPRAGGLRLLLWLSVDQSETFWRAFWEWSEIIGDGPGEVTLQDADKMPGATFFPEARINFAENLLRRRDDSDAIVFRAEDKVE